MTPDGVRAEMWRQLQEARAENDRLRAALSQIAVGRILEDDAHPLGPVTSMVHRFLNIAQDALRAQGDEKEGETK